MNNNFKITCKNLDDTAKLANVFAKHIKDGVFACLFGEIGAGKTAFVKLLAKEMGITDKVTSPSFVILNDCVYLMNKIGYWGYLFLLIFYFVP